MVSRGDETLQIPPSPFMESVFKIIMFTDGSSRMTECLTQLNNRNLFSHRFGNLKVQEQGPAGFVFF